MKISKLTRVAVSILPYFTLSMCPWITPPRTLHAPQYQSEQKQYEAAQKIYGAGNVSMAADGNMLINGVEVPFGAGS